MGTTRHGLLMDLRPLTLFPAYRRLFFGNSIAQLGAQMTTIAVAIQVYDLTRSSWSVGLLGLFALVPMVGFGLYGGVIADRFDRRTVSLLASLGLWLVPALLLVATLSGSTSVGLLYGCTAAQSALYALNNPARNAMIPRLVSSAQLPAAVALNSASANLALTLGPLAGALLIDQVGYAAAYAADTLMFSASVQALIRLPRIPPARSRQRQTPTQALAAGLAMLRRSAVIRTTFVIDLAAMVFANPSALFPAMAVKTFAGDAGTVGVLQAAAAAGALTAFVFSGWLGRVGRQGAAVVTAVVVYGLAIGAVGLTHSLGLALTFLAIAGMADMVSAAFRSTILHRAAPDEFRGRVQGVFVVVVTGGPQAGNMFAGMLGETFGEQRALVIGGLACVAAVALIALRTRTFVHYRDPGDEVDRQVR